MGSTEVMATLPFDYAFVSRLTMTIFVREVYSYVDASQHRSVVASESFLHRAMVRKITIGHLFIGEMNA
jgi:hypothetical protein